MIRWLVQSKTADAALESGTAPPGLLNATETQWLDRISGAERRSDWLLGRWTAKQLVQSYLAETSGVSLLLKDLTLWVSKGSQVGILQRHGDILPGGMTLVCPYAGRFGQEKITVSKGSPDDMSYK